MNILTIEDVSIGFTVNVLLDCISLGLEDSDRIGLVGINGTGKTTLLKLIAGQIVPDSGMINRGRNITIRYLPQEPYLNNELTVLEQIFEGDDPQLQAIRNYELVVQQQIADPDNADIQEKFLEYAELMNTLDAWNKEVQAKTILNKLGINNYISRISELSGGLRKRVAMAEALIQSCDILILDEPTNHIDYETIIWLEGYLAQRKGALLLVTHDRYFLNRVVNRIVEIDKGKLFSYDGNFEYFLEKKAMREEMESSMDEKRRKLFLSELAWIKKGAKARTTKQKARIDRFSELKDTVKPQRKDSMDVPVAYTRLGRKVIEIEGINKSYGSKRVVNNFSMLVKQDDRIGIIGANGSGKSTLLGLIAGALQPDSGTVDTGETVKLAYYRQNNEDMDYDCRVIDFVKQAAEFVETSDGYKISASQMLERFLFDSSRQFTQIRNLSGGERRRLYLAKTLMEKPNVLLLDEPTNDLDIQTLEVLEEYLDYFQGAVLVVSHDRYFLDKITDKILGFGEDGSITEYNNLEAYGRDLQEKAQPSPGKRETVRKVPDDNEKKKMTYKEKQEYDKIENDIDILEKKLQQTAESINDCGSDYIILQELTLLQEELQQELSDKMDRWAYLTELAERRW